MKLNNSLQRMRALCRKHNPLIREIQTSWNNKIPAKGSDAIWASTLGHLVDDLGLERANYPVKDLKAFYQAAKSGAVPAKHETAQSYVNSAILANLFGKIDRHIPGVDPLAAAEARFDEAEMLCRQANRRLIHYRNFDFASRPLVKRLGVHEVFHLARRKIAKWLSDYEPEDLLELSRHGPGGTGGEEGMRLKRPFTTPYFKFAKTPQGVTEGAYFLYLRAIAQSDTWISAIAQDLSSSTVPPNLSVMSVENRYQLADTVLEIARGNDVGFVPKNYSTKRSISSEPQGCVYVQLGIGGIFREALKRVGCDLDDQSRNQELAYAGTVEPDDEHCPVTIDLKMASDCEATELIRELFEPKWFDLMDAVRSREGRYKGVWFKWAKFSSMGNGFTFELESMVFYALSQACCDLSGETQWFSDTFGPRYKYGQLSVYGDDIIVPKACASHLIQVLRFCGFRTNLDKTFLEGPFRESCGTDWFDGVAVRTAYYKGDLSRIKDIVKLLNVVSYNNELLISIGSAVRLDRTLSYLRDLLSVIAPTVFFHLRSTRKTLGFESIWVKPDEAHVSRLVVWDVDMQSWLMPEIRTSMESRDGRTLWRYVQFLYSATGDRLPIDDPGEYESLLERNPFAAALTSGGSAGDIMLAARDGGGKIGFRSVCEDISRVDASLIRLADDTFRSIVTERRETPLPQRLSQYKRSRALQGA